MKIRFVLQGSLYDCEMHITDASQCRCYRFFALDGNEEAEQFVDIDIQGEEFDLALIPLMPDIEPMASEFHENTLKDKLTEIAGKAIYTIIDKMILRVGCNYHIKGLQDGDRLDITLQNYVFGTFDRFDLFELIPMMYMFFEVANFNSRFTPIHAYAINRKEVVRAAKALALTDSLGNGLFLTLFSYPIQVSRIKRLTKNKKVFKTLSEFHSLSDEERQKFIKKQEAFVNN